MKFIGKIIGIILFIAGIIGALVLSLYTMLAGGIASLITGIQLGGNAMLIATGIVRILFFEVGMVPGILVSILGVLLYSYLDDLDE